MKKNKVFILSKIKDVLSQYPEYKDQDVYYFNENHSVMDLIAFKPDYIIVPKKDEVINVNGLLV